MTDKNKIALSRFDLEVSKLYSNVDMPDSNDKDMQELLAQYHLGNSLEKFGKGRRDAAIKKFKQLFADKIKKPTGEAITLHVTNPFKLEAKVNSPRETFDKDEFIEQVAMKFEEGVQMSRFDLVKLAEACVKKSAAPVSFTTSLVTPETDE